jgi:hypothetical protein
VEEKTGMSFMTNTSDDALMSEILEFTLRDRHDLAVRLLEINAQRSDGEISEDEFELARADLYA